MPIAAINEVDLYYERHGDRGVPLVLVHGYTGDISDWRFQIAEFAPTHRVLVSDNRGHGQSPPPADASAYSIELMATDIEQLAAALGFERYHLVGHSMGGAIAQEIALRGPDKLLSLTLHDTSYCFNHRPLEMPDRPPPLPAERLQQVATRFARMSPESLLGCFNALLAWHGTEKRAAQICTPTLILCGADDSPMIVDGSRRLAELIPGSELCLIPATTHAPQEESPLQYNAALRRFLERG
ncbi:MAG: alpha/beta hydrolase [Deltaproteobacteria bacterium]|nr:alpha/beta hydrolase [Deltaproteobacteria bacterium]